MATRTVFGRLFDSIKADIFGAENHSAVKAAINGIQIALASASDEKEKRAECIALLGNFDPSWVAGHPASAQVALVVRKALSGGEFPAMDEITKAASDAREREEAGMPPQALPWEGDACEGEATGVFVLVKRALEMPEAARPSLLAAAEAAWERARNNSGHQARAEAFAAVNAAMDWVSTQSRRLAELQRKAAAHELLGQVQAAEDLLRRRAAGRRTSADEMADALSRAMRQAFTAGAAGAGPFGQA